MRYSATDKLEIIRLVETSSLSVRRTLATIGIAKSTFYAWLDRYETGGFEALHDRKPKPGRVWNRIPDDVRERIVELTLEEPELSSREVAVAFGKSLAVKASLKLPDALPKRASSPTLGW